MFDSCIETDSGDAQVQDALRLVRFGMEAPIKDDKLKVSNIVLNELVVLFLLIFVFPFCNA